LFVVILTEEILYQEKMGWTNSCANALPYCNAVARAWKADGFSAQRIDGEKMVEAGESEHSAALKTDNFLKNGDAKNAPASENAPNWNVSGAQWPRRNTDFETLEDTPHRSLRKHDYKGV
jgi:hypothetical protein